MSRTTVYNHWPTREDLLRATIDSIGKATPDVDDLTGSLRVDLEILCQQLVSDLIDEQRAPMIANMMERALHDPAVVAVRNEFLEQFEGVFGVVISTAIAAGELRRDLDTGRAMAGLLGSFLFARFMAADGFDQRFADAVIDDFVRTNAPALTTPGRPGQRRASSRSSGARSNGGPVITMRWVAPASR